MCATDPEACTCSARDVLNDLGGVPNSTWRPTSTDMRFPPSVVSDLALVQARLDHAKRHRHRPEIAIPTLQAALALVRGAPDPYGCMDADTSTALTLAPVAVADLLAQLQLEQNDVAAVLETTTRGLAVLPAHIELVALRMRAHAAAGDAAALKAEYAAYLRAEQSDPIADGHTDPALRELFHELLRSLGAAA
jgi:hypothetical protein